MIMDFLQDFKTNEFSSGSAHICYNRDLKKWVPIESISKMIGHTKLTTIMVYAKVVKQKLSMDMALLQSKFDKIKHNEKMKAV